MKRETAQAKRRPIPNGFSRLATAPGASLYRDAMEMHFVHVIEPAKGARLHSILLPSDTKERQPALRCERIRSWWEMFSARSPLAFSVCNGQFFDPKNPRAAALAFTVKTDGNMIEGYGDKQEYPGQKLMLVLDGKAHDIVPYDDNPRSVMDHKAATVIIGLREDSAKSPEKQVGRTVIGSDGEHLYLLVSKGCTQNHATEMLTAFGGNTMMHIMLDGGDSSNLMTRYSKEPLIETGRMFPHALGIASGARKK